MTQAIDQARLFQAAASVFAMALRIAEGFRTGEGVGWHEPASTFVGYDYHEASIDAARRRAWVADSVNFDTATAVDYPGTYDLVACFDALHDMGDPVAAARHVLASLAPNGTWMIVEPRAGDRVEDNLNPVGRLYYALPR